MSLLCLQVPFQGLAPALPLCQLSLQPLCAAGQLLMQMCHNASLQNKYSSSHQWQTDHLLLVGFGLYFSLEQRLSKIYSLKKFLYKTRDWLHNKLHPGNCS